MDYYNTTDYGNLGNYGSYGSYGSGLAIGGIIYLVISLAISIVLIVGLWKLFKKCGKGGWEAIVPIYNFYVLVEIAGLNWWWFLAYVSMFLILIPGVAFIAPIAMLIANLCVLYNLSKKFHKSTGWFVASIFLSGILLPVLGYSSKEVYDASAPVSKNGLFGEGNTAASPAPTATVQNEPANATNTPVTPAAPIAPVSDVNVAPAEAEVVHNEVQSEPVTPVMPENPSMDVPVEPEVQNTNQSVDPFAVNSAPAPVENTVQPQATTSPIGLSEVNSDVVNVTNNDQTNN